MSRRFGLYAVAGVLSLATAPAYASHIPGATYTGHGRDRWNGGVGRLGRRRRCHTARGHGRPEQLRRGRARRPSQAASRSSNHAFSSDPADSIPFEGFFPDSGRPPGRCARAVPKLAVGWLAATGRAAHSAASTRQDAADLEHSRQSTHSASVAGGESACAWAARHEPCRVSPPAAWRSRAEAGFRLKPASARLAEGGSVRLEPKLGRRALEAARTALRNDRRVRGRGHGHRGRRRGQPGRRAG